MAVVATMKKAVEVLQEAWFLSRVPGNEPIFRYLRGVAEGVKGKKQRAGLRRYLEDYPPIGQIEVKRDWFYDKKSGEMHVIYANTLFADGCLRFRPGKRGVVVFLPGIRASAEDVVGAGNHPQNMTRIARELDMGLVCWDWPLQGLRRDRCVYQGLRSVFSGEREYSRILPALGTSLWRELVAELQFALEQIRRHVGPEQPIHVVGWSMGGCFAYLASLLGVEISATISAGSCARVKDLLAEGKTRLHGYFFYPLNGLAYFDLEDVVGDVLTTGHPLQIIYGERDAGCLESTRMSLADKAAKLGRDLRIEVLPNHGHAFSPAVKDRISRFLSRYCSETDDS